MNPACVVRKCWRSLTLAGLLFVAGAAAHAQQPADSSGGAVPAASADSSAGSANSAKPKKVFTNDDVAPAPASAQPASKPVGSSAQAKDPNEKLALDLRAKLKRLQTQLQDLDGQIETLKRFEAGEPVGDAGRQLHKGYNSEPIPEQITKLQAKHAQLQEQIEAVFDEARKKNIPPGLLR